MPVQVVGSECLSSVPGPGLDAGEVRAREHKNQADECAHDNDEITRRADTELGPAAFVSAACEEYSGAHDRNTDQDEERAKCASGFHTWCIGTLRAIPCAPVADPPRLLRQIEHQLAAHMARVTQRVSARGV